MSVSRKPVGKTAFFIFLFLLGILFRLGISSRFPQPLIWDQEQYYGYALGILHEGLHGDTVRLYGYPVFIVPFIAFFGKNFQWPFTIFQSLADCMTAVIVYALGKKLFPGKGAIAWIGYTLYLFNPFTPAYAGVILTEILAIFLVTLIFYLLLLLLTKWSFKLAAFLILLLGYLPQIRPSFQYATVVLAVFILFGSLKKNDKVRKVVILIILYFLPYVYNVTVNIYRYHQFALQSVDNVFIREVYISFFVGRAAPPGDYTFSWPPEVYAAWFDFSSPTTPEGRKAMSKKYTALSLQKIAADPAGFLTARLSKAWYVWEKHYLFPYIPDQGGKPVYTLIYIANVLLLFLFVVGYFLWYFSIEVQKNKALRSFGLWVCFLIFYISLAHVFSTSEERFSLPGYQFLYLFAGYTLFAFFLFLKRITIKTDPKQVRQ